jgi:NIMA (never in mitosis gene a)-related kinase
VLLAPTNYYFQRRILAAEVLEHLLASLTVRQDVARAGGVRSLLYLLGGKAEELTLMALRCLSKLCASNTDSKPKHGQIAEASSDLRLLGGIPVLLSRINRENGPVMSSIAIAVCTLLATLAFDDECSFEIRQKNGVYLLGDLIIQATPGDDANSESISEAKQLQLYAFRALRLLFCVERNRKVFKRLFSPDLFALFIDVGHYVMKLDSYLPLVAVFNSVRCFHDTNNCVIQCLNLSHFDLKQTSPASRASTIAAFDDLKSAKESDRRVIGGYVVEEVLGKGAFGTVYQVRAVNGEKAYAMKQLPLKESALQLLNANLNGAAPQTPQQQQQQLQQSIGEICKEVEIISKYPTFSFLFSSLYFNTHEISNFRFCRLEHPNIVSYYTSFVEGSDLFIVMELIEGASLADHLSSLQEKGQEFQSEEKVWPVFIQLCLALSYLHLEKRVVHRDLTPNNVMLDRQNHVKITDFGLARQRQSSQALLQSAVGTISYSCPEIVQHQVSFVVFVCLPPFRNQ